MIELALVCATIALTAALLSGFYLSQRLVRTNEHLIEQNTLIIRHALAINSDCREFERIRVEADTSAGLKAHVPLSAYRPPDVPIHVDGSMPISPNGDLDYATLERGN